MNLTLAQELSAEPGSFLFDLRGNFKWNHQAFVHLARLIFEACQKNANAQVLPKEQADGVYYLHEYGVLWAQHEHFDKAESPYYYEKAYKIVKDLTDYYFLSDVFAISHDHFTEELQSLEKLYRQGH